jgi:hypothetical protein
MYYAYIDLLIRLAEKLHKKLSYKHQTFTFVKRFDNFI